MGGTSTDVSRYAGEFERRYEHEIAGVRVVAPMLAIHTVAAGGGSICRLRDGRLTVGPESAGSDPGPLCYGRPGAQRLDRERREPGARALGHAPLPLPARARAGARPRSHEIAAELRENGHLADAHSVAEGFFEIANRNMAEALRKVSVARGFDVREHALVVFGGAGGQHACALARLLGIGASRLSSALGRAVRVRHGLGRFEPPRFGRCRRSPLERRTAWPRSSPISQLWSEQARAVVAAQTGRWKPSFALTAFAGWISATAAARPRSRCRYAGESASELRQRFEALHAQHFGHDRADAELELTALRVEARVASAFAHARAAGLADGGQPRPERHTTLWHQGKRYDQVPVFEREALTAGARIRGPALIAEAVATIVIEPGFELECRADGILLARPEADSRTVVATRHHGDESAASAPDPVTLEVMSNAFMSIAEQMGHTLQRTAQSTNIRERLDFSCAIFDAQGGLVANAPHIPVHLGAMSESVRAVLEAHPTLCAGDALRDQ